MASRDRRGEIGEQYVAGRGRERGVLWRKGKGRLQRIRKERSPAPAYVMPSSYCQPAPAPFCLPGGEGGLSPRPQYREPQENSDRADIDLRPIICMLIVRRRQRNEQYSRSRELPKPISFNPLYAGMRYANMSQESEYKG